MWPACYLLIPCKDEPICEPLVVCTGFFCTTGLLGVIVPPRLLPLRNHNISRPCQAQRIRESLTKCGCFQGGGVITVEQAAADRADLALHVIHPLLPPHHQGELCHHQHHCISVTDLSHKHLLILSSAWLNKEEKGFSLLQRSMSLSLILGCAKGAKKS